MAVSKTRALTVFLKIVLSLLVLLLIGLLHFRMISLVLYAILTTVSFLTFWMLEQRIKKYNAKYE